jgi:hypothetical protein
MNGRLGKIIMAENTLKYILKNGALQEAQSPGLQFIK